MRALDPAIAFALLAGYFLAGVIVAHEAREAVVGVDFS